MLNSGCLSVLSANGSIVFVTQICCLRKLLFDADELASPADGLYVFAKHHVATTLPYVSTNEAGHHDIREVRLAKILRCPACPHQDTGSQSADWSLGREDIICQSPMLRVIASMSWLKSGLTCVLEVRGCIKSNDITAADSMS